MGPMHPYGVRKTIEIHVREKIIFTSCQVACVCMRSMAELVQWQNQASISSIAYTRSSVQYYF
jgi:hypothetical protein